MRTLLAFLLAAALAPVLADEAKTKKGQSSFEKAVEKTGRNLWISPSDKERRERAAKAKAKKEAAK